ncbi:sulfatase [Novipirellula artificiosorum]|uniref:Arylsulfatase n=1 Tax=Novipirellula artificiosorum TaxID=2528016 RepID=A0A5C6D543_9BACT|nr:sulfatase [Novipirellula artificiosorum]TWU31970.1 Arylsulfatase [Novipirellula artificiosorum]
MKSILLLLISLGLLALPPCGPAIAQTQRSNVLFIPIDDLNHWVGHLGRHPQARTPHIDRLAAMGVSFNKAYCAAPACNPSRIALMSGMRPSTTGCYDNSQDWRPTVSEETVLNKTFLDAGYNSFGTGKIYHGSYGNTDKWTEFHKTSSGSMTRHPSAPNDGVGGIKFCPLANRDNDMPDYDAVSYGIEVLNRKHDKPFFLAVGLVKPHMPFSVPKKWFDQFPLETIQLPTHRDGDLSDVPAAGVRMAKPEGDHAAMLRSGRWKEAVQAYLATIAFCDAQVGRLLDAFEQSAYRDNTIICLWSDHGWSLGEKEHWRKFALWEEPTRAVFIWKVPGLTPAGVQSPRPVDFMSIYPTLCALTGIKKPDHVEGLDISSLLKDPNATWDVPALTTFHKDNHSFRSEQWRYIRYADGSEELYDHSTDPYEWTNVAADPRHSGIKAEFARHFPSVNTPELPNAKNKTNAKKASRQATKAKRQE